MHFSRMNLGCDFLPWVRTSCLPLLPALRATPNALVLRRAWAQGAVSWGGEITYSPRRIWYPPPMCLVQVSDWDPDLETVVSHWIETQQDQERLQGQGHDLVLRSLHFFQQSLCVHETSLQTKYPSFLPAAFWCSWGKGRWLLTTG